MKPSHGETTQQLEKRRVETASVQKADQVRKNGRDKQRRRRKTGKGEKEKKLQFS